ncbi:Uncharacterised protein [Nocardia cyriacigeorgica]|uniref:Uncharacterized protein n=1 Tax=Nocardia cyriacigeorgica TaxID=135487 RepID=A0A4U8W3P0_9NOCA|nr:Uncharacterised protein [Nocardia cyriacigeorgica]
MVGSFAVDLVEPGVGCVGFGVQVVEGCSAGEVGEGVGVVVYGDSVGYGDVGQAGFFGYFAEDRCVEGFSRVYASRRDLGSCFGEADVIEDEELRGCAVSDDVGGYADSRMVHCGIVPEWGSGRRTFLRRYRPDQR